MSPIFIPSKGRATSSKLLPTITTEEAFVVVEPKELDEYKKAFPELKFLTLPINDAGITFVRNWIKEYTEDNEIKKYWQLDDDISNFYYRVQTKMVKAGLHLLTEAEEQLCGMALSALEYQQLAWSATKPLTNPSYCDVCVLVDNTQTFGMRYNQKVEGKEDRDFAMQCIKAGLKVGRTTLYAFAAPKNGSNKGGLKEIFYDLGKEEQCAKNMVELWGEDVCNFFIKPDGRPDVKIIWKNIKSNQTSLF